MKDEIRDGKVCRYCKHRVICASGNVMLLTFIFTLVISSFFMNVYAQDYSQFSSIRELYDARNNNIVSENQDVEIVIPLTVVGKYGVGGFGGFVVTDGKDFINIGVDGNLENEILYGRVLNGFKGSVSLSGDLLLSNNKKGFQLEWANSEVEGPIIPEPEEIDVQNLPEKICLIKMKGKLSKNYGSNKTQYKYKLNDNILVNGSTIALSISPKYDYVIVGVIAHYRSGQKGVWYIKELQVSTEDKATVTVNVDDVSHGVAWIDDDKAISTVSKAMGKHVTLKQEAKAGYEFAGWKHGDLFLGKSPELTVLSLDGEPYTATYVKAAGNMVMVSAGEGGTANINGVTSTQILVGNTATVIATPSDGYRFVEWQSAGKSVSRDLEYTFTPDADIELVAVFEKIDANTVSELMDTWTVLQSADAVALSGNYQIVGAIGDYVFLSDGKSSTTIKCRNEVTSKPLWSVGTVLEDLSLKLEINSVGEKEAIILRDPKVVTLGTGETSIQATEKMAADAISSEGQFVSLKKVRLRKVAGSAIMYSVIEEGKLDPSDLIVYDTRLSGGISEDNYYDITGVMTRNPNSLTTKVLAVTKMIENGVISKITVSVIAEDGGTAWIGTEQSCTSLEWYVGHPVTIHAQAEAGREFKGWKSGNDAMVISEEATFLVTPTASTTYTATFSAPAPPTRKVSVVSANPLKGRVEIVGIEGSEITTADVVKVKATPLSENDFFVRWTDAGNVEVSTQAEYEYTGDADITLTAHFISRYPVTISAPEGVNVTLTKSGEDTPLVSGTRIDEGTVVHLSATAGSDRVLKSVTVNDTPMDLSQNGWDITVDKPLTIVITDGSTSPIPPTRKVSVVSANPSKGRVEIVGIEGSEILTADVVKVKATPLSDNDFFVRWTDAGNVEVSTQAEYEYTGDSDITLTAHFISRYPVTISAPDGVNVTLTKSGDDTPLRSGARVDEGTVVELTVLPKAGRVISSVTVNGTILSVASGSWNLTVDKPLNIVVVDAPDEVNRYRLGVLVNDATMGSAYIDKPGIVSTSIGYFGKATCVAVPAEDCVFEGWRVGDSEQISNRNTEFKFDGLSYDVVLTAVFAPRIALSRRVSVSSSDQSKGKVMIENSDALTIESRRYVTVIAEPINDTDFFVDWTDATGAVVSTSTHYTYRGAESISLRANFKSHYAVYYSSGEHGTVSIADKHGNNVESGSIIDENERLTIKAVPDEHYQIESVSVNGEQVRVDDNGECIYAVLGETEVLATFKGQDHILNIVTSKSGILEIYRSLDIDGNGAGGKLRDGDKVTYGETLHIFAVPNDESTLTGISINGVMRDADERGHLSIMVSDDMTVEAIFDTTSGIDDIVGDGIKSDNIDPDKVEAVWDISGRYLGRNIPKQSGMYIVKITGVKRPVKLLHRP